MEENATFRVWRCTGRCEEQWMERLSVPLPGVVRQMSPVAAAAIREAREAIFRSRSHTHRTAQQVAVRRAS
ncbi:hypothetical protein ACFC1T_09615 [Kitasatospora sp. NPDC056076]|uniref:hypothetical protein n=1 Tax=Kitasatospora sp. NPDC056076 TaxID=3345703 RepID=UPI0035DE6C81